MGRMDGLALLAEARAVGLSVAAEGDRLRVRGPKSAAGVAAQLLAAKPAVLAALAGVADGGVPAEAVWWDDRVLAGSAPVLHLPPRGCVGPRACARLGPCPRHAVGLACEAAP